MKLLFLLLICISSVAYACGDNPNAIIQGPFKDDSFENGYICFQHTPDKRDVEFYLSYESKDGPQNNLVDVFFYSDAPVEVMSVFFAPINTVKSVVVLLRWNVNYEMNGIEYPYYYEVKAYHKHDNGYELKLNSSIDAQLAGYQTKRNSKIISYPLDNAKKIKQYLTENYGT
ncbi:hypothetical protein [Pseudaeromonas paramecii]